MKSKIQREENNHQFRLVSNIKTDQFPFCSEQLLTKISHLLEVTHNLKSFAYKLVRLPFQNNKTKFASQDSSILTCMDSIFYDLKRVQTILEQQQRSYNFNQGQSKWNANIYCDQNQTYHKRSYYNKIQDGQNYSRSNLVLGGSKIQRIPSQLSFYKIDRQNCPQRLSKAKKLTSQVISNSSQRTNHNNLKQNHNKYANQNLQTQNRNRNRKQSHQMRISKVSSFQYLGVRQMPQINIRNQLENSNLTKSQMNSQYSHSNPPADWDQIQVEQYKKNRQNQKFLREIHRNRQKYLKNIIHNKNKCLKALDKLSQKLPAEPTQKPQSKQSIIQKRKSKTQNFSKSQRNQHIFK